MALKQVVDYCDFSVGFVALRFLVYGQVQLEKQIRLAGGFILLSAVRVFGRKRSTYADPKDPFVPK